MRQIKIPKSITVRNSLGVFLNDIKRIDLLTVEEELRLVELAKSGDIDARNKLISANLRFVVSIAKQYQSNGLELVDLINEGSIGLVKAISIFDPTRGFKFTSYAVWWIRQSIILALSDKSRIVRIPLNRNKLLSKTVSLYRKYEQEYGYTPSEYEIASLLNVDINDYLSIKTANKKQSSLDVTYGEDDDFSLKDSLKGDDNINSDLDSLKVQLELILDTLTERERYIIKSLYLEPIPKTLEEISMHLGLSRERVRQLKELILKKLSNKENKRLLKQFL